MANQIVDFTDANGNIINSRTRYLEEMGIYSTVLPNWDNSSYMLNLSKIYNGGFRRVSGTAGTEGVDYPRGLPTELQNKTCVCMRVQYASKVSDSGAIHGVLVLYEVHPVPGRIWVNVYNVSWKGWKSITLT